MIREQNVNEVLNRFDIDSRFRGSILQALNGLNAQATGLGFHSILFDGVVSDSYIGCYDSQRAVGEKRGAFLFGFDVRKESLRFVFPREAIVPNIPVSTWNDKPEQNRVFIELNHVVQSIIEQVGMNVITNHDWR